MPEQKEKLTLGTIESRSSDAALTESLRGLLSQMHGLQPEGDSVIEGQPLTPIPVAQQIEEERQPITSQAKSTDITQLKPDQSAFGNEIQLGRLLKKRDLRKAA